MISTSIFLEVNLKNLILNYKHLSSLNLGNNTGATIKADAYGLGDKKIIKTLYNIGCKHFFVATIEEAIKIRKKFKFGYLYILNGIKKNDLKINLFNKKIIPIVNSIQQLKELQNLKKKINIGIHIDTGINRLGIPINDLYKIKNVKNISIILVMSHLASADERYNNYNKKQLRIFEKITNQYF